MKILGKRVKRRRTDWIQWRRQAWAEGASFPIVTSPIPHRETYCSRTRRWFVRNYQILAVSVVTACTQCLQTASAPLPPGFAPETLWVIAPKWKSYHCLYCCGERTFGRKRCIHITFCLQMCIVMFADRPRIKRQSLIRKVIFSQLSQSNDRRQAVLSSWDRPLFSSHVCPVNCFCFQAECYVTGAATPFVCLLARWLNQRVC